MNNLMRLPPKNAPCCGPVALTATFRTDVLEGLKRSGQRGIPARWFAGAMAWTLPNPSGLDRNFTLDELVTSYSEFRDSVVRPMTRRLCQGPWSDCTRDMSF